MSRKSHGWLERLDQSEETDSESETSDETSDLSLASSSIEGESSGTGRAGTVGSSLQSLGGQQGVNDLRTTSSISNLALVSHDHSRTHVQNTPTLQQDITPQDLGRAVTGRADGKGSRRVGLEGDGVSV